MSAEVTAPSGKVDSGMDASVLSSNALPIGTRVHEFEITRVVGEGGFSVVYLAFDHTLHRSIALKEYIPSALAGRRGDNTVAVRSAQHQQTFEAGLRSFINEARLLAQFDHPALVKVYRFWEANGTAYMAMPYYEGRTLKQILREHPERASEAWLKQLLAPILDALDLLHGHRCYHRDIAPDNIQVLESNAPVLLDFGAARRTIGDMTQAFTVILKPGYAPIEQYADEADLKQGPWTDVYALSAVLYAAVVGKPPPTAVARVIKDPLEPLSKRALAGYSAQFLAGIDRGLAVRPEARPQSIAEIRQLLGVQGHGHRLAEVDTRIVAAAARSLELEKPSPANAEVAAKPASVPAEPTDSVPTVLDVGEPAIEKDRTVLVPGLRRTVHRTAAEGDSSSAQAAATRSALFSRPIVLGGVGVVLAVVIALVAFYGREHTVTVADKPSTVQSTPGSAAAPSPTPSAGVAVEAAPKRSFVDKPADDTAKAAPPRPPLPPPPTVTASAPQPSVTASAPPPSVTATAPVPADRPAPTALGGTQGRIETAPSAARPLSDDERRWAAIRDSDRIADFYAFQLKYPNSPRGREVAAKIAELEQKLPKAPAAEPAPVASSEPSARISAPAVGSKAVVRVRVRPFGYVYVDGVLIGASPPVQSVEVGPGKHRIEARNPEARPPTVSTEVDVTGTQPRDVQLRFSE
jgi:non-specific serine/threonine protein kinase